MIQGVGLHHPFPSWLVEWGGLTARTKRVRVAAGKDEGTAVCSNSINCQLTFSSTFCCLSSKKVFDGFLLEGKSWFPRMEKCSCWFGFPDWVLNARLVFAICEDRSCHVGRRELTGMRDKKKGQSQMNIMVGYYPTPCKNDDYNYNYLFTKWNK
jgi:hypothetical protein